MITGGQTVMNPWPIIGGAATSVCTEAEFIRPEHLEIGDVIVLTKPLGTQVAVNAHQWLALQNAKWDQIKDIITSDQVENAYQAAMHSMARLNRTGARLMVKYGAHGATDVTGFGILGHACNLAQNQATPMDIEIHTLPIFRHLAAVDQRMQMFSLLQGTSAETSGGLMLCLPADRAQAFMDEIQRVDGNPAWVVGRVIPRQEGSTKNDARITADFAIVEV